MAHINLSRLESVAVVVKKASTTMEPMNFHSYPNGEWAHDEYPKVGDKGVLDFFFFTILHQFGFWYGNENGYVEPLYGTVNGKHVKGANLLFAISMRAFRNEQSVFEPKRLAVISPDELFRKIFVDDNGPVPFPDLEARLVVTREYGKWFVGVGTTPEQVVAQANESSNPLQSFLNKMCTIGGYNHDMFIKRQTLLAMVLANRPEKFLRVHREAEWPPVIDYHVMRVMMRLGIVEPSPDEILANTQRQWVSEDTERNIRVCTFQAVNQLSKAAQIPNPSLDNLLWSARRYCPEMEPPTCSKCVFNEACGKHTKLFQPVYRTTDY